MFQLLLVLPGLPDFTFDSGIFQIISRSGCTTKYQVQVNNFTINSCSLGFQLDLLHCRVLT